MMKKYKYQGDGPIDPPKLAVFTGKQNRIAGDKRMPYMKLSEYKNFTQRADLPMTDEVYLDPYNHRYLLKDKAGTYKALADKDLDAMQYPKPARFFYDKNESRNLKGFALDIENHLTKYPDIRTATSSALDPVVKDVINYYRGYTNTSDFAGKVLNENRKAGYARADEVQKSSILAAQNLQEGKIRIGESQKESQVVRVGGGLPIVNLVDQNKSTSPERDISTKRYGAPFDNPSTVAHELSHVIDSNPLHARANDRKKELQRGRIKEALTDHDKVYDETKADIRALRYKLTRDGFIDPQTVGRDGKRLRETTQMQGLEKNWPKIKDMYNKEGTSKRLFDQFDDETIMQQLIDYSATQNNNYMQYAKFGGMLKTKYEYGGNASSYYSPVGLPMDPSFILQQQRDEKEAKRKQTLQGILGVASTAASFIPGVGPAIGAGTSLLGNAMYNNGGKMMYDMGGDLPLASDSFQVKGNPNVTDGNAYGNVRLDHNEVVKDNFVFSDSLYNPTTGKKFSEEALEIERATKKAEKRLSRDNDQISRTGIEFTNKMSNELASLQEQVAEAMGLRNRPQDGLRERSMSMGGERIDPLQPPAYHRFYDPARLRPQAQAPVEFDMARAVNENEYWQNAGRGPFLREGIPPSPPQEPITLQAPPTSRAPGGKSSGKKATPGTKPELTYMEVEELPYNYMGTPTAPLPNTRSTPLPLSSIAKAADPIAQMRGIGADAVNANTNQSLGSSFGSKTSIGADAVNANTNQSLGSSFGSKTSIGDILQAATVASKFFGLKDKPQRTYLDNTPISQEVYDPRAALFQNQQSFQGRINALDTPSENLRRALANQMLSTKYSTDSQVATQYDNMNERARTNYEQRLSQRSQYNNQQSAVADDIRQRDRAQYRNNIDTAMQSVGEFGKSLGDKETAYDVLRMYRELYPDVYERLVGNYMNKRNAQ